MEPLTLGVNFLVFLGGKLGEWAMEKAWDTAYDDIMAKMAAASPETASKLALPPEERKDIGEAVLIEEVKQVAQKHPEVKAAVEALGNDVNQAAKTHPELEKAIKELTEALKNQSPSVVNENWQGINIKGGTNTIDKPTFTFGK
ncbi:MAG: hypothetical protein VKL59_22245 [Nostocaceae cyanobacterium]|nr:hypothetical protein [Nostocaceae cyanobacterium]